MAAIANKVVKKADELTNITYDALVGAAGDNADAFWRQDTGAAAGLPTGLRATLRFRTGWNGPKTARKALITFERPYATQDTTTTLYSAKDRVIGRLELVLPQAIPATELNESVHQFLNLLAETATKTALDSGYAPT